MGSELQKKMRHGEAPATPEEWKELGELLTSLSNFCGTVSVELDAIEDALIIIEKTIEVLAETQTPAVQNLLREVVNGPSQGVPVPEMPEESIEHLDPDREIPELD